MADKNSSEFDEAPPTRLGPYEPGESAAQQRAAEHPETMLTGRERSSKRAPSSRRRPSAPRSTGAGDWAAPEVEELAQLLPQYQIEKLLGRGGMAAVYKGLQIELDRPVAIKILPAELASDEDFVNRFRREARVLARLQHPGIVAIYDFGLTSQGHLYFVMEYVDGTDLNLLIRGAGLKSAQTFDLICQVCDALNYAHLQGVIHRDIKPSNILVSREGCAKLADFGLARPQHEDFGLTGTHMVMGTPDYMAPEQCDGIADHRADIFALGVTLYVMLTGRPPRGAFEPASSRAPVDTRIDEVVLRALQAEPNQRYQQVSELRADVDRIRSGPPEPLPPPIVETMTPAIPGRMAPAAASISRRAKKAPLIAALALILLLGLGAAYILKSGKEGVFGRLLAAIHPDTKGQQADAKPGQSHVENSGATASANKQDLKNPPNPHPHRTPAPIAIATPFPKPTTPDPAILERARLAEEAKRRKEEDMRRQETERQKQEALRRKAEMEERQRQAKIDADVDALRKAGRLDAGPILSSATGGYSVTQSILALWQREGYKMRKDPAAALHWAGLAAAQENPVGQAALAFLNWGDDGLKADRDQAAILAGRALPGLKILASRNEPAACYALGRMYALGIGVPKDSASAADWYRHSSDQGFALAQRALATMYETGDGTPKDPAQAQTLRDQAATAYLLKRESVSTPGGIVGFEPGAAVVIVAQKNGLVTVKTKNYQFDVAEANLTWDGKAAQAMLDQAAAAQRAFKEKAAAELAAQKQQQEAAVQNAQAVYAKTPARILTPAEQLAALQEDERKIRAQMSDVSAQLGQIRVVGSTRTSPNAAAAMNARKGLSDQMAGLDRQLRDVRNQQAKARAAMNAPADQGGGQNTGIRGASLQPARGGL